MTEEELGLMLKAVSICLVLTGIHGYLGIHVLERKVIFVDLAMAQIAALGATYALFLGYTQEEDPGLIYVFSLGFTLVGAAVFSLTRVRHEKIPQEALIGIVYATASAVAILVLVKTPHGDESIKRMLVGNILLAGWGDVAKIAAIYAGIGAFHWFFRDRFFRISLDAADAYQSGMRVRLWDFLFYATFGVVIASSVAIAGVLLVFSFLIVPAAIGVMFASKPAGRLAMAWGAGTVVSFGGICFNFYGAPAYPPGPIVVAMFALTLLVAGLGRYVAGSNVPMAALGRVAAGGALAAVLVAGTWLLRKPEEPHTAEHHPPQMEKLVRELGSADEEDQRHALDHLPTPPDPHLLEPLLDLMERTKSEDILQHLAPALAAYPAVEVLGPLREATARDVSPETRLALAKAILELRHSSGLEVLLGVATDEAASTLTQLKALRIFDRLTGKGTELQDLRAWWNEHGDHVKWREAMGRFE